MTKTLCASLAALALAALAAGTAAARSNDTTLTGAGSTFVAPLVAAWTPAVGQAYGYSIQYSGIGSGGGIAAVTARTVDFGASDAPLSDDQFKACNGCVQIPWALSATAVLYKLPGVKNNLKINGRTLADIYLGKI